MTDTNNKSNNKSSSNAKHLAAYSNELEKHLRKFSNASEWSDFIGYLTNVEDTIKKYNPPEHKSYLVAIPSLVKRLTQCLNPVLPNGVHIKALEVYNTIFTICVTHSNSTEEPTTEFITTHFSVITAPLFSFGANTRMLVIKNYLSLFERYIVPLCAQSIPVEGALRGLLPLMESDASEWFPTVYKLIRTISTLYTKKGTPFYPHLAQLYISDDTLRQPVVNYMSRAKESDMDPLSIETYETMVKMYCLGLKSESVAVATDALEQTNIHYPLIITKEVLDTTNNNEGINSINNSINNLSSNLTLNSTTSVEIVKPVFKIVSDENPLLSTHKEKLQDLNKYLRLEVLRSFLRKEPRVLKRATRWFGSDGELVSSMGLIFKQSEIFGQEIELKEILDFFYRACLTINDRIEQSNNATDKERDIKRDSVDNIKRDGADNIKRDSADNIKRDSADNIDSNSSSDNTHSSTSVLTSVLEKYLIPSLILLKSNIEHEIRRDKIPVKDIQGISSLKNCKIFFNTCLRVVTKILFTREITDEYVSLINFYIVIFSNLDYSFYHINTVIFAIRLMKNRHRVTEETHYRFMQTFYTLELTHTSSSTISGEYDDIITNNNNNTGTSNNNTNNISNTNTSTADVQLLTVSDISASFYNNNINIEQETNLLTVLSAEVYNTSNYKLTTRRVNVNNRIIHKTTDYIHMHNINSNNDNDISSSINISGNSNISSNNISSNISGNIVEIPHAFSAYDLLLIINWHKHFGLLCYHSSFISALSSYVLHDYRHKYIIQNILQCINTELENKLYNNIGSQKEISPTNNTKDNTDNTRDGTRDGNRDNSNFISMVDTSAFIIEYNLEDRLIHEINHHLSNTNSNSISNTNSNNLSNTNSTSDNNTSYLSALIPFLDLLELGINNSRFHRAFLVFCYHVHCDTTRCSKLTNAYYMMIQGIRDPVTVINMILRNIHEEKKRERLIEKLEVLQDLLKNQSIVSSIRNRDIFNSRDYSGIRDGSGIKDGSAVNNTELISVNDVMSDLLLNHSDTLVVKNTLHIYYILNSNNIRMVPHLEKSRDNNNTIINNTITSINNTESTSIYNSNTNSLSTNSLNTNSLSTNSPVVVPSISGIVSHFVNDVDIVKYSLYLLDYDFIISHLMHYFRIISLEYSTYPPESRAHFYNRVIDTYPISDMSTFTTVWMEIYKEISSNPLVNKREYYNRVVRYLIELSNREVEITYRGQEVKVTKEGLILSEGKREDNHNEEGSINNNSERSINNNSERSINNNSERSINNNSEINNKERSINNKEINSDISVGERLNDVTISNSRDINRGDNINNNRGDNNRDNISRLLSTSVSSFSLSVSCPSRVQDLLCFGDTLFNDSSSLFISTLPADSSLIPYFYILHMNMKCRLYRELVSKYSSYMLFMLYTDFNYFTGTNISPVTKMRYQYKLSELDILAILRMNLMGIDGGLLSLVLNSIDEFSGYFFKMVYCVVLNTPKYNGKCRDKLYKKLKHNRKIYGLIKEIIVGGEDTNSNSGDIINNNGDITNINSNSNSNSNNIVNTDILLYRIVDDCYLFHRHSHDYHSARKSLAISFTVATVDNFMEDDFFTYSLEDKHSIFTRLSPYIEYNTLITTLLSNMDSSFFGTGVDTKLYNLRRISFLFLCCHKHIDRSMMESIIACIKREIRTDTEVRIEIYRFLRILLYTVKEEELSLIYPIILEDMTEGIEDVGDSRDISDNTSFRLHYVILSCVDVSLFMGCRMFDLTSVIEYYRRTHGDKHMNAQTEEYEHLFDYNTKTEDALSRFSSICIEYYREKSRSIKKKNIKKLGEVLLQQFKERD